MYTLKWVFYTGKLQNNLVGVIKERKLVTKNNLLLPMYTVYIAKYDQVLIKTYYSHL
jgi:hypothetical protein